MGNLHVKMNLRNYTDVDMETLIKYLGIHGMAHPEKSIGSFTVQINFFLEEHKSIVRSSIRLLIS